MVCWLINHWKADWFVIVSSINTKSIKFLKFAFVVIRSVPKFAIVAEPTFIRIEAFRDHLELSSMIKIVCFVESETDFLKMESQMNLKTLKSPFVKEVQKG